MASQRVLKDAIKGLERRLAKAEAMLRFSAVWLITCSDERDRLRAAEKIKEYFRKTIDRSED